MPFELFYIMPPIGHMDWIGFGLAIASSLWDGLDWVGFGKLDPRPTLCRHQNAQTSELTAKTR